MTSNLALPWNDACSKPQTPFLAFYSPQRNYALFNQDTPGEYVQKLTATPEGEFFLDELVSDQKLGVFTGKELLENGLPLRFEKGYSPLKVIRMLPKSQSGDWGSWNMFRMPEGVAEGGK